MLKSNWQKILLVFALSMAACQSPSDFTRDNPHDPEGSTFKPEAPTQIFLVKNGDSITLNWKDNTQFEDGYIIERAYDDSAFVEVARLPQNAASFSDMYKDKTFVIAYRITPFQTKGSEIRKTSSSVEYNIGPSDLRGNYFNEEVVTITWKDNSNFETGFVVERQIDNGEFKKLAQVTANIESIFDTARVFGNYIYRIQALSPNTKSRFNVSKPFEISYWIPGPNMPLSRPSLHYATLLKDGRVLLQCGDRDVCDIYDPVSKTWLATDGVRFGCGPAILLSDGRVLNIANNQVAQIYDPSTGIWSRIGDLPPDYLDVFGLQLLRLNNGNVLITAEGHDGLSSSPYCAIFEAGSETFRLIATMKEIRQYHTATLLPNGKVLITGGISSSGTTATAICEIFDPIQETWNIAASLSNARALHFATLLNDGRVFVAGGEKSAASPLNSCEIYDPISNQWDTSAPFFNQYLARAVRLSDGRILAITDPLNGDTRQTEIFDPILGKWSVKTSFPSIRLPFPTTATLLPNGKVLVTNAGIECEIYRDQSM